MSDRFLNFKKVLILSPHPDDAEYSFSGTVLKYKGTQFDILNMTSGGDFDKTTFNTNRIAEVKLFWEGISNISLHFTDVSHLKSKEEDEWVSIIENMFNISDYDAIISTNSTDSHFEHRRVSTIATALCRVARVSLLEYRSPSTLVEWIPNLFIDVASTYEEKLIRLYKFKSQLKRKYFANEQIRGFHINFQASKRGLKLVEMLRVVQLYG